MVALLVALWGVRVLLSPAGPSDRALMGGLTSGALAIEVAVLLGRRWLLWVSIALIVTGMALSMVLR